MATIELSNYWGSGIDMWDFTADGWGYIPSPNPSGVLNPGYNSITFNAYGFEQYDNVTVNYYYDGYDYVVVEDVFYYDGSTLVQTLGDLNIQTTVADLNAPEWYVRFNQGNDRFVGNDYGNQIKGGWGDDILVGGRGYDYLFGDDGNDTLIPGLGLDALYGGAGIDTAAFDGSSSEWVFEQDIVSGSIRATDMVEDFNINHLFDVEYVSFDDGTYSVRSLIPIVGTSRNNTLIGDSGDNRLKGLGGNDTIKGLGGDDYLYGGAGNDVLSGGSGRDNFVFDVRPNRSTNNDKITDFRAADDTIWLDNAVFTKIGADGALKAAAFRSNMTGQAQDRSDRIIYEKDTGKLFYDADGTGSAASVHFATLTNKAAVNVKDFYVL
ncbi:MULTISPECIES: calcium-binding protein [Microvirga]|uniref:calcium-binding protein n=1 Tax=Microvirga TaxID=186650 RepID=UPI0021C7CD4D|nr:MULTISPECIES: calcium-binding protein [unclassified Microvirga]